MTDTYWRIAADVCTDAELQALTLRARGLGTRRIALALRIARSSVRERLDNADRKITSALAKEPAA